MKRTVTISTLAIVAILGAVLAVSFTNVASANLGYMAGAFPMQPGGPPPPPRNDTSPGNVTINASQAKTLVQSLIANLKIGTVTSDRMGWMVPIEDSKGMIASIFVNKANASTADQAKNLVQASLQQGWNAGEPKLMRTVYDVPLLNSNNAVVSHVRVDGKTGEIMRQPSTILSVTSQQAKTTVTNAIPTFKVGNANNTGTMWTVGITYQGKLVMTVQLAKLNTPTSNDAMNAVQNSLSKSWTAGEPKQLMTFYEVPILDNNGNTIGTIRVDGTTGAITTAFPPPFQQPPHQ